MVTGLCILVVLTTGSYTCTVEWKWDWDQSKHSQSDMNCSLVTRHHYRIIHVDYVRVSWQLLTASTSSCTQWTSAV